MLIKLDRRIDENHAHDEEYQNISNDMSPRQLLNLPQVAQRRVNEEATEAVGPLRKQEVVSSDLENDTLHIRGNEVDVSANKARLGAEEQDI